MASPGDTSGSGDTSGIGNMLSEALSALGRFQDQGEQAGAEPPEGTGEAADGMITVRAVRPGRIEGLWLDPRAMRMASETLTEEIMSAVNAALAELQAKSGVATGQVDVGGLGEQLRQIQANAERQLSAFTAGMVEAQSRLARKAGGE